MQDAWRAVAPMHARCLELAQSVSQRPTVSPHCLLADQVAQPQRRQSVCLWSPCHVPTMCPSCSPSSPSSSKALTLLRASAVPSSPAKACPWSASPSCCRYAHLAPSTTDCSLQASALRLRTYEYACQPIFLCSICVMLIRIICGTCM